MLPMKDDDQTLRPSDSYVQSFARGLEVIRSFGAAAPRQTLTEVAEATGMTGQRHSAVLRMAASITYMTVARRSMLPCL